jgi:hypothetical protein
MTFEIPIGIIDREREDMEEATFKKLVPKCCYLIATFDGWALSSLKWQ